MCETHKHTNTRTTPTNHFYEICTCVSLGQHHTHETTVLSDVKYRVFYLASFAMSQQTENTHIKTQLFCLWSFLGCICIQQNSDWHQLGTTKVTQWHEENLITATVSDLSLFQSVALPGSQRETNEPNLFVKSTDDLIVKMLRRGALSHPFVDSECTVLFVWLHVRQPSIWSKLHLHHTSVLYSLDLIFFQFSFCKAQRFTENCAIFAACLTLYPHFTFTDNSFFRGCTT